MAMNGIGQFDLYNSYRLNRVDEQDAQRLNDQNQKQTAEDKQVVNEPKEVSLSLNLDGIRAKQNMSLSDVSLSMNQPSGTSYEMKALSFQPENDEVDKALSDIQKDSALMQYSYFVGESNVVMDNEDGVVLRKINPEEV